MEKNTPKDAGRRRIGRIVVIAVIALAAASIAWWLLVYGRDVLALLTDGRRVQEQAARLGPLAPVALAGLVAVQQLSAVLPAEPLELAAGYAFGFWKGALVCFAGSLVGAVAIIVLVRLVGDRASRSSSRASGWTTWSASRPRRASSSSCSCTSSCPDCLRTS